MDFLGVESEIAVGVVERNVRDDAAEPLDVVRELAGRDLGAKFLAEDAAEVLVAGVAQERTLVGEHADEVAQAP